MRRLKLRKALGSGYRHPNLAWIETIRRNYIDAAIGIAARFPIDQPQYFRLSVAFIYCWDKIFLALRESYGKPFGEIRREGLMRARFRMMTIHCLFALTLSSPNCVIPILAKIFQ